MRHPIAYPLLFGLLTASVAPAMDGIAVTAVRSAKYYWDGKLMRYDIANSKVSKSTVLLEAPVYSPSLNMSGTFVAFFRNHSEKRWISIMSVDGGRPVDIAAVSGARLEQNLWWQEDGTILYQTEKYEIRRIRMSKDNGKLKVTDERAFYLEFEPSGDYVDMDMKGAVISFRIGGNPYNGGEKVSNDVLGAAPTDSSGRFGLKTPGVATGMGCGNAISPSGKYVAHYTNSGHSTIPLHTWPAKQPLTLISMFSDLPQWNTTISDSMGRGGLANGWSVNSDRWMVASLGCDGRFARTGSDQFLINWKDKVAINTSKGCNSESKYHVIRGDLWVKTRVEVNEDLHRFLDEREADKQSWASLLNLPLNSVRIERKTGGMTPGIFDSNGTLRYFDSRGRWIPTARNGLGAGPLIRSTEPTAAGIYLMGSQGIQTRMGVIGK